VTLCRLPQLDWLPVFALRVGLGAAVYLGVARLTLTTPRVATVLTAAAALFAGARACNVLTMPADERITLVRPVWQVTFDVTEASLVCLALVALLLPSLRDGAKGDSLRNAFSRLAAAAVGSVRPDRAGQDSIAVGLVLWSFALVIVFAAWTPLNDAAVRWPLGLALAAIGFACIKNVRAWHVWAARTVRVFAALGLVATLMPVAYGLVIVYLLLTWRGTVAFCLAVWGTVLIARGTAAMRRGVRGQHAG
jgi:hypothetical protein